MVNIMKFVSVVNKSGEPRKYGYVMEVDVDKLEGVSTKSLYIKNGYLVQRGNGGYGGIRIFLKGQRNIDNVIIGENFFNRISILAIKANALISKKEYAS